MQKVFHYFFGICTIIAGGSSLYYLLNPERMESLRVLAALVVEAIISLVFFIMLEPRPRVTQAQVRHDERIKSQGLNIILLVAALVTIVLFATSCSRSITVHEAANGKAKCGRYLR